MFASSADFFAHIHKRSEADAKSTTLSKDGYTMQSKFIWKFKTIQSETKIMKVTKDFHEKEMLQYLSRHCPELVPDVELDPEWLVLSLGIPLSCLIGYHDLNYIDRVMFRTLEALSCLHFQGIVHRDLKPGNVVIVPESIEKDISIKLIDFETAERVQINWLIGKNLRDSSRTIARYLLDINSDKSSLRYIGFTTYSYCHPEELILLDKKCSRAFISAQSLYAKDIWSWGATYLTLLTGSEIVSNARQDTSGSDVGAKEPLPHSFDNILLALAALISPPRTHAFPPSKALVEKMNCAYSSPTAMQQKQRAFLKERPQMQKALKWETAQIPMAFRILADWKGFSSKDYCAKSPAYNESRKEHKRILEPKDIIPILDKWFHLMMQQDFSLQTWFTGVEFFDQCQDIMKLKHPRLTDWDYFVNLCMNLASCLCENKIILDDMKTDHLNLQHEVEYCLKYTTRGSLLLNVLYGIKNPTSDVISETLISLFGDALYGTRLTLQNKKSYTLKDLNKGLSTHIFQYCK